ncbi:unnamed protein product, partial [Prorocentrum cordatum]
TAGRAPRRDEEPGCVHVRGGVRRGGLARRSEPRHVQRQLLEVGRRLAPRGLRRRRPVAAVPDAAAGGTQRAAPQQPGGHGGERDRVGPGEGTGARGGGARRAGRGRLG